MIYETFLNVKERDFSYVLEADGVDDRFDYVNGRDLWDINQAAFGATCQAHGDRLPGVWTDSGPSGRLSFRPAVLFL